MAGTSSWGVVYEHLVLIESHWTAQIQNQQQRNAALLTVTGFLLGFSGFTGAQEFKGQWGDAGAVSFAIGLLLLALALVAGIAAMAPRLRIGGDDPWLDAPATVELGNANSDEALRQLTERISDSGVGTEHMRTLEARRRWILVEIVLILAGLIALGNSIRLVLL